MRLFHGTNVDFDKIDISKSNPWKDFGKGFYLTDIYEQALKMGKKKALIFGGEPIVQEYEFDEGHLHDGSLNILSFSKPDKEWAKFIFMNRNRRFHEKRHKYDIVYGPIANDGVAYLLGRYDEGSLNLDELARMLKFKHLNNQYYFGTEKAISLLRRIL
ncbi:MAG TPA: hypothetical protein DEQ17_04435 [Prevotella sp.]|nr:hypothetical protein [Prevotella sp.]